MENTIVVSMPGSLRPLVPASSIRIGGQNDGGYVLPKGVLESSTIVLSFGINLDWTFETEALKLYPQMRIHSYDGTTTFPYVCWWGLTRTIAGMITWKKRHLKASFKIASFISYCLNRRVTHSPRFVGDAKSSRFITISEVLSKFKVGDKVFAKIDIEGAEYDILPELAKHQTLFQGFAFEFHHGSKIKDLHNILSPFLDQFAITHVHVNNVALPVDGVPEFLEVTLVRKELLKNAVLFSGTLYQNPLATANVPENPGVMIRFE